MAEQAESIAASSRGNESYCAGPRKFLLLTPLVAGMIGIMIYNWDARLRGSAILGFCWCRGIGLHLRLQISNLNIMLPWELLPFIVVLVIISETIHIF